MEKIGRVSNGISSNIYIYIYKIRQAFEKCYEHNIDLQSVSVDYT